MKRSFEKVINHLNEPEKILLFGEDSKIKVNNIATTVLRSLYLSKYFYTYDNVLGDKWFIIINWFVNPD